MVVGNCHAIFDTAFFKSFFQGCNYFVARGRIILAATNRRCCFNTFWSIFKDTFIWNSFCAIDHGRYFSSCSVFNQFLHNSYFHFQFLGMRLIEIAKWIVCCARFTTGGSIILLPIETTPIPLDFAVSNANIISLA